MASEKVKNQGYKNLLVQIPYRFIIVKGLNTISVKLTYKIDLEMF